jgi:DNA-binding NtrC family response regulator
MRTEKIRSHPHSPPASGATILLVERDQGLREALAESLRVVGYRPLVTDSPSEALRLARDRGAQPAALVINDLVMPGMNALEFYEALHMAEEGGKMLIITAYPMPQTGAALLQRPGVRWARKPIGLKTLQDLVGEMIGA